MNESQPLEPTEQVGQAGNDNSDGDSQEIELAQDSEKVKGIPFGFLGASLLMNVLQYAVFLGLSMVILILIRIFMPAIMQMGLP